MIAVLMLLGLGGVVIAKTNTWADKKQETRRTMTETREQQERVIWVIVCVALAVLPFICALAK